MSIQRGVPSPELSVAEYARLVSTANPTPGGGSVAGITGALAAGLAGMVCALTRKGTTDDDACAILEPAELGAGELRLLLLDLAVGDETAYARYRAAAAMPKMTDIEKSARNDAAQLALSDAAEAPLAIARACFALLEMLPIIATRGTRHALSDASASALLAEASMRAALLNVHVNAGLIKNVELGARLLSEAARLEIAGAGLRARTLEIIRTR